MSLHYEVVFTTFLRDETPTEVLDVLRWHLGLTDARPLMVDDGEGAYPLLSPDPDSYLPGGESASLRRQLRGRLAGRDLHSWGLFARSYWLDDEIGEVVNILDLLAPHVEDDGYGGYMREIYEAEPTVFVFRNGSYETGLRR